MERLKNEYGETEYFTYSVARAICKKYQWLVGSYQFDTPYGLKRIDYVMPVRMSNGKYCPMVIHDVYLPPEVPEFYHYKSPANYLLSYLEYNNIPFVNNSDINTKTL